jgi:putative acetyltransferase
VLIEPRANHDGAVTALVAAAEAELAARYGDDGTRYPVDPAARFLVAFLDGEPVGCGALQGIDAAIAEIKRMFVEPMHRRRGVARRLLAALEDEAAAAGFAAVRLETGVRQPEALAFYRSAGYRRMPAYGPYLGDPMSVCFSKDLRQRV